MGIRSGQRLSIQVGLQTFFKLWGPALLIMILIFAVSSIPSEQMPSLGKLDLSVKKTGHALGYALLALAYRRGLGNSRLRNSLLAWCLAVLYAMSDEFHQSFVPGRGATFIDVGIDAVGAGMVLWLASRLNEGKGKAE